MHGGKVSVSSEGVGRGAEFCVRLPLSEPAVVQAPAEGAAAGVAEGFGSQTQRACKARVLVVEDNEDFSSTLQRLLTVWGHEARVVPNGGDAEAEAVKFRASVVLLDIGLPGLDGCAVANQLLASAALKGVRIIAMTGYGQETDRVRALAAGCHEYLLKPVDPAVLKNLLREAQSTSELLISKERA